MAEKEIITNSSAETLQLGNELARELRPPVVLFLSGELCAGKTTLAKGIISGLGAAAEQDVTSPSFSLVHEFRGPVPVVHVDLYRMRDAADIATLGLEDVFASPAVVIIEWAEKLTLRVDWPVVRIHIAVTGDTQRLIHIEAGPVSARQPSRGGTGG